MVHSNLCTDWSEILRSLTPWESIVFVVFVGWTLGTKPNIVLFLGWVLGTKPNIVLNCSGVSFVNPTYKRFSRQELPGNVPCYWLVFGCWLPPLEGGVGGVLLVVGCWLLVTLLCTRSSPAPEAPLLLCTRSSQLAVYCLFVIDYHGI
jgi:hypothetical protein